MKRAAKDLCREAERLGYRQTGTNTRGFLIYTSASGHEVRISPSITEHQARAISKTLQQATGTYEAPVGRNAQAVKERQGRRRELDGERLAAERRDIQAEHDAYLARIAAAPYLRVDGEVLRRAEARERRLREIDALMRSTPAGGEHQGRRSARHTAGERDTAAS